MGPKLDKASDLPEPISSLRQVGSDDVGSAVVAACPALLGRSPLARRAADQVRRAAAERGHVLILAEPGLEAEGVARVTHSASSRAEGPYVPVDCAGGDPEDLDRLLFGSFERRSGRRADGDLEIVHRSSPLVAAGGGTVCLVNVRDLSASTQVRLARLMRDGEARLRESGGAVRIGARVMATSSPILPREVEEGRFCADLYRRLSRLCVDVPALRERTEDIPAVVAHLADEICRVAGKPTNRFTQVALLLLAGLPWRGNTDELRALLERVLLSRANGEIRLEDVLGHLRLDGGIAPAATGSLREARSRFERDYVVATLQQCQWRMRDAARALGIQRSNLYRKVRQLGIPRSRLGD